MSIKPQTAAARKDSPKRSGVLWFAAVFVVFVCIALVMMESWFAWTSLALRKPRASAVAILPAPRKPIFNGAAMRLL